MWSQLIKIILVILSPVLFIAAIDLILLMINIIIELKKGKKIIKSESKYKKTSWIKRLCWQFPKRLALDIVNRDPNHFREYGLHMFCGEQGSGKTVAVVEMLLRMKEIYPKVKIRTNMDYKYEDGKIESWRQLIKCDNGEFGQIEVIDEIQAWF